MILTDTRSSWIFEMHAYAFQYPLYDGIDEWDRKWLQISLRVSDGSREWRWTSPCLMFSEAKRLATWLQAVAGNRLAGDVMDFIEPEMRFEFVEGSGSMVSIRLHLYREPVSWGPPTGRAFMGQWMSEERSEDRWFEVYHDFTMGIPEVLAAADSLLDDLRRLPPREGLSVDDG